MGREKVEAHQDNKDKIENLDCWAKANIMADKQAKSHLRRVMRQEPRPGITMYKDKGWMIRIGNKRITRHFQKQLIYHCTKVGIKCHWCNCFEINLNKMGSIDWKVCIKTTKDMSAVKRLFITKHAAEISATGRNMVRRQQHETSQYPRCKEEDKHTRHIIMCKGKGTKEVFNTGAAELGIWLGQTTSKEMEEAIREFLMTFRKDEGRRDWSV